MTSLSSLLFLGHLFVFGAAAVACFASIGRTQAIDDPDTRRGLVALLITSGGWAAAHFGFLLVPTTLLKLVTYQAGLIVGLSTVGPWLYFCSAFTGRSLHRNRTLRRVAVAVFLAIVAVKVTNPLHHRYFTSTWSTTPFPHLAIHHGFAHWVVMGLAYALASVGYFMLLELFLEVGQGTRPLGVLVGMTSLPLVLDVLGFATPYLLPFAYEPLGVAAFALGVSFVYLEELRDIRLTGTQEDPAIVLSESDRIRDFNTAAGDLFPALRRDTIGEQLLAALPSVAEALGHEDSVLDVESDGETRYYRLTTNDFGSGGSALGRVLVLTDVTHRERYRRELERQNERLDQFASMVSHDLRNPLNVAQGRVEAAREECDSDHLDQAAAAHDRMETMIEDLLALARQGQPIEETEPTDLATVAERAWDLVETGDATLEVEGDLTFRADPDRLQHLFENLFRNAVEHGSTSPASQTRQDAVEHGSTSSRPEADDAVEHAGDDVVVTVGPLPAGADGEGSGFYVADDGPGIPPDDRDEVFESGYTTDEDGTGFGLAIVAEVVDAHGWEIAATESESGGARFEVAGVDADG